MESENQDTNKPVPTTRINAEVEKKLRIVCEQQKVSKQGPPNISARGDLKSVNGNSTLTRYFLQGDNKELAVVVKKAAYASNGDGKKRKFYMMTERFRNEIVFYSKILPGLRKSGVDLPRIPVYYYHEAHEKAEVLVIEDLAGEKYFNLDTKLGLDRQHVKAAVEALAKFHNALLEWKKKEPVEFYSAVKQLINVSITEATDPRDKEILTSAMKTSMEAVSFLSSVYLTKASHENVDKCLQTFLDGEFGFDTTAFEPWTMICHGSCWVKNFLFKHNKNNEIEDVALIDFECITATSPLQDISTFLLTSTDVSCLNDLRPFYAKYKASLKYNMDAAFHAQLQATGRVSFSNSIYFLCYFALYETDEIDKATEELTEIKYNFLTNEKLKSFSKRLVSVVKESVALRMI